MQCCPACAYPLDGLPGVPPQDFAVFEQDVACPECGFVIPQHSRVLIGSGMADALQPISARRRWMLILATLAPMWFLLRPTIESLYALVTRGSTGGMFGIRYLGLVGVPIVAVLLYLAIKRWSASDAVHGKRAIEVEQRWLVAPGTLVSFSAQPGRRKAKLFDVRDFRRIASVIAPARGLSKGVKAATVSEMNAVWYKRDKQGRRSDMATPAQIYVRCDHVAPAALGAHLTETLLRTDVPRAKITLPEGVTADDGFFKPEIAKVQTQNEAVLRPTEGSTATAMAGEAPLPAVTIESGVVRVVGSPLVPADPARKKGANRRRIFWWVLFILAATAVAVAIIVLAVQSAAVPKGGKVAIILSSMFALVGSIVWLGIRGARERRILTKSLTTWTAVPGSLRIHDEYPRSRGRKFERDRQIAAADITQVLAGHRAEVPLLVTIVGKSRDGRPLAELVPDDPRGYDPAAVRDALLAVLRSTPQVN